MTSFFPTGGDTGDGGSEAETPVTDTMQIEPQTEKQTEKPTEQPEKPTEPEPLPPTMEYRQLTRRLSGLDPRVVDLVERHSRALTNNIKSYVAAEKTTRDTPLTDVTKEKRRKRAREVTEKLESVREERTILERHRGTAVITTAPGDKIARNKKVTQKSVGEQSSTHILGGEDAEYARPFGHHKGAFKLSPGAVKPIYPEVKIGEQTRQYLSNLSNLLFAQVSTMEVEAMLVNDRILVSTNETETVNQLAGIQLATLLKGAAEAAVTDNQDHELLRRYKIGVVGQALAVIDGDTELTTTQLAGVRELAELESGFRTDHDARKELESFLRVLKNQVQSAVSVKGPFTIDVAAGHLTDPAYKKTVMAVQALDGGKSHAEQHLTLVVIKSGYSGRAVVAGTKIPCAMCWLTLALAQQNGWNIEFNNRAGGFWDTSVFRGLTAVAAALNVTDITDLWNMFVRTNNIQPGGTQFVQYLTSLRQGTDLTITVPPTGGGLAAHGLTQDISGLHVDFMEDTPDSPLGSPFPDPPSSPPGHWGTPPSSPSRQEAENQQQLYDAWKAKQSKKTSDTDLEEASEVETIQETPQ